MSLPIKHNASLFFRISIKDFREVDEESKEIILKINSVCTDLEYLNYLFHKNFSQLNDEKEINMLFPAVLILANGFYIHLSTIYLLLKQLGDRDDNIKKLLNLNKDFFEKIQVIRNCILVHKEKEFYKKPKGHLDSTDPKHWIESKIVVHNSKLNKDEVYFLRPLRHTEMMFRLLENTERLMNDRTERKTKK